MTDKRPLDHAPSARDRARDKVAARREAEARRAKRARIGTWVGVGVVVAAMGAGVAVGISSSEKVDKQVVPKAATTNFAIPVGDPDAPVLVDIYEDFQCPACAQFEELYGPALDDLVVAGDVRVDYHMMAFLGPDSERATAAAGCAADVGKFREFHATAYTDQGGGYTSEYLLGLGDVLDLGDDYEQCVRDDTYADLGTKIDAAAAKAGVSGTPTVFVDGRKVEPQNIVTAIDAALRAADAAGQ